jgi:hypothetical protein
MKRITLNKLSVVKIPGRLLVSTLSLLLNPLFLVPFLAGAAYSYFDAGDIAGVRFAEAEPPLIDWDDKDNNPLRRELAEKAKRSAEEQKNRKKGLANEGVLSQTHNGGTAAADVDVPWGTDVLKDKPAPIAGSVSRVGAREWVMKLINNTEDTYSVSVEVVQTCRDVCLTKGVTKIKSDNYSYTLKSKQTVEKKFTTVASVTDCSLKLTRWKNITGEKRKKAEEAKKAAEAKQALEQPTKAPLQEGEGMPTVDGVQN